MTCVACFSKDVGPWSDTCHLPCHTESTWDLIKCTLCCCHRYPDMKATIASGEVIRQELKELDRVLQILQSGIDAASFSINMENLESAFNVTRDLNSYAAVEFWKHSFGQQVQHIVLSSLISACSDHFLFWCSLDRRIEYPHQSFRSSTFGTCVTNMQHRASYESCAMGQMRLTVPILRASPKRMTLLSPHRHGQQ